MAYDGKSHALHAEKHLNDADLQDSIVSDLISRGVAPDHPVIKRQQALGDEHRRMGQYHAHQHAELTGGPANAFYTTRPMHTD